MVQALGIEDALLNIAGDGDRPCTSCYGAMTWLTWTNLSTGTAISLVHRKSDQTEGVDFDRVEVIGTCNDLK